MLDEIEQEPSPDPRSALQKAAMNGGVAACAGSTRAAVVATGVAKPRLPLPLPLLLEHAFGTQMLEGRDEWQDVADVIRSSFLVVAKELKRHDKRLRVVEATNHHYCQVSTQKESGAEARWRVLQEQMALFSDELQLLSQQLQQLKERQDVEQKQFTTNDGLELEKGNRQRAEERHARLKRRLARLETRTKHAVERTEDAQSSMYTVKSNLCVVATELRDVKLEINHRVSPKLGTLEAQVAEIRLRGTSKATDDVTGSSARSDLAALGDENLQSPDKIRELFAAQAQCKQEIRRLQHALVAHDQGVMTQAEQTKRRVEKMKHQIGNAAAHDDNTIVKTQTKQPIITMEARGPQPPSQPKGERKTDLPVQDVSVIDRELKPPPASKAAAVSVSESHATLKQRFAKARQKQQESLRQLRERQQQHQV